jgi:large subunit ribosomal protein L16
MQLMPKRVKFRKSQRGTMKGCATRGNTVVFGDFGLMALEMYWITARQIEAARMAATHALGTSGRLYMRVFPHKPISAKPAETRMGKGKGEPEYYAAVVRKGTILIEIAGVPEPIARQILNLVAHKMPIRVRMVARRAAQ